MRTAPEGNSHLRSAAAQRAAQRTLVIASKRACGRTPAESALGAPVSRPASPAAARRNAPSFAAGTAQRHGERRIAACMP
jgi:hypothetical protein